MVYEFRSSSNISSRPKLLRRMLLDECRPDFNTRPSTAGDGYSTLLWILRRLECQGRVLLVLDPGQIFKGMTCEVEKF